MWMTVHMIMSLLCSVQIKNILHGSPVPFTCMTGPCISDLLTTNMLHYLWGSLSCIINVPWQWYKEAKGHKFYVTIIISNCSCILSALSSSVQLYFKGVTFPLEMLFNTVSFHISILCKTVSVLFKFLTGCFECCCSEVEVFVCIRIICSKTIKFQCWPFHMAWYLNQL